MPESAHEALKQRLAAAHEAIAAAIDEAPERLPSILTQRDADLRALASAVSGDSALTRWAEAYLREDLRLRDAMAQKFDAARTRLSDLQDSLTAQRRYISTGLRR